MRPQPGDHFVYSSGDEEGQEIKPEDLYTDQAPVLVWAMAEYEDRA